MTKIKLDFESDEKVEKVVVDVKYVNKKTVVKEYIVEPQKSDSIIEKPRDTPIKSHGFDSNMMDIVNA